MILANSGLGIGGYMVQRHSIILWKKAEKEDKKFEEIAKEVLDFTVLEQLADEGHDTFGQCKQYMKKNTLKHCEEVEKYFL